MYESSINERYIDEITDQLRRGQVIIYPTDSLYALGCDAVSNQSVERVCRIKGINPDKQHLSIVCADISMASEFVRIDNHAFKILKANLPGPFTFILPSTSRLSKAFKGRKQVGVRIPDNEIARRISGALGNPLLTTSASWDEADADDAALPEALEMHFRGQADAIIDGGEGREIPSAVVDLTDSSAPVVLREGAVPLIIP